MSGALEITILGCGSSSGVPRSDGAWGACDPADPRNHRTRCSLLARRPSDQGPEHATTVLIDTSPDLRIQAAAAEVRQIDAVLFTHDHADQTHGIDDLRAFAVRARRRAPCHMDAATRESLTRRFDYIFRGRGAYPPICEDHLIPEHGAAWSIDGPSGSIPIVTFDQDHGLGVRSVGYRLGPVAYSSDVVELAPEAFDTLYGVKVWIVDALRYQPHPTHSHLERTLDWIARVRPERAILTNMHIDLDFATLAGQLPAGVEPAVDGLRFTVDLSDAKTETESPHMAVLRLKNWNLAIGEGQPLVCIAGLNVIEDLDLALETARYLKAVTAALDMPFIFKASFDKANRSSAKSYRGPGLTEGLKILTEVKTRLNLPIATDIHEIDQAEPVAQVAELVQIPAFLCRQTDLVNAAAQAVARAGGWLHVKKGQFLAPEDCRNILDKIKEAVGTELTVLCERGVSFGYHNMVVDMLGIAQMKALGAAVTIDATHSVQLPGANPLTGGASAGGRREGVPIIAKAAVAAGADGVFLEFHPRPDEALCDGPSCLPLSAAEGLLTTLKAIHAAARD